MHGSVAAAVTVLTLLATVSENAAAQRRPSAVPRGQPEQPSLTIEAKAGGRSYRADGSGECRHASEASIRGVPASLWMVQYAENGDEALKQLSLTLWRPKNGAKDQVSLWLETRSGSHRIEIGGPGKNAGAGTVSILPKGPGGRLKISGKDGTGKPVQVTIDCPAFAGVEAEGG